MQMAAKVFAELIASVRRVPRGAEQRRTPRSTVNVKVNVTVLEADDRPGRTFTAVTRDLSLSGMDLFLAAPLQKGQRLLVTLPRPDSTPVLVRCTVVHCSTAADGIYTAGTQFQTVLGQGVPGHSMTHGIERAPELVMQ